MIYDTYILLPELRKNFDFVNKPFFHDTKRHRRALKQHLDSFSVHGYTRYYQGWRSHSNQ